MPVPILRPQTYSPPISLPINPFLSGVQSSVGLMSQLQQMKEKAAMAPMLQQEEKQKLAQAQAMGPLELQLQKAKIAAAPAELQKLQFGLQHPLLSQSGAAGQIGALIYLKQHPELEKIYQNQSQGTTPPPIGSQTGVAPTENVNNAPDIPPSLQPGAPAQPTPQPSDAQPQQPKTLADIVMGGMNVGDNLKRARTSYYNTMAQSVAYRSAPVDQKSALLAQAAGMGYDPTQATTAFMHGKSIFDLAKEAGFDSKHMPNPIYPLTVKGRSQIQQRQQALQEVNTINPILAQAVAPYSRRIAGHSLKQISEALSGTDEDSQAKFLAATALMPEMSGMRFRAMAGTQLGIESIREITNASLGHIKVYQPLVSPSVYKRSQQYLDQWINKGVTAANEVNLAPYRKAAQATSAAPQQAATQPQQRATVKMQVPGGRFLNVYADKVDEAIRHGARRVS